MTDALSQTFAALADPTRLAILERLSAGEATVTEIAAGFELSQPTISAHLKVLEAAGLIRRGRVAQTRPCALDAAAFERVRDWLARYRGYWNARLDRLEDYLDEQQKEQADER